MKYARVVYKGVPDKIGRFSGEIQTGDMLTLLPSEYSCISANSDFEFVEWTEKREPEIVPAQEVVNFLASEAAETDAAIIRGDLIESFDEEDEEDEEDERPRTVKKKRTSK